MSTKVNKSFRFNKNLLQYGCYLAKLNSIRQSLFLEKVSQSDFARYLRIDPKNLSDILSGRVVPNAALFEYMYSIFNSLGPYTVFLHWLDKFSRSSLSRYRSRRYRDLFVPSDCDF